MEKMKENQYATPPSDTPENSVSKPAKAIVHICFYLGMACIVAIGTKSLLEDSSELNWAVLLVGFILCLVSLSKVSKIEKKDSTDLLNGRKEDKNKNVEVGVNSNYQDARSVHIFEQTSSRQIRPES